MPILPYTFMLACTFICFSSNLPPVHLFFPVRLIISGLLFPLYVYPDDRNQIVYVFVQEIRKS